MHYHHIFNLYMSFVRKPLYMPLNSVHEEHNIVTFMVNLITLSVAQTMWHEMIQQFMSNELERIFKEVTVA
jgi:hypothetical protein